MCLNKAKEVNEKVFAFVVFLYRIFLSVSRVHMLVSLAALLSVFARKVTPLSVMVKERTFIAVKPDGVQRGLIGEIIKRFEAKGFKLAGMKYMQVS